MDSNDMPLSFVMALTQNESAMTQFRSLPRAEKDDLIKKSKGIATKKEMQSFVNGMFDSSANG